MSLVKLVLICALLCSTATAWAQTDAPTSWMWGAAFSAHQTEGVEGGGETSDWYAFEHPPKGEVSPIGNSETADIAVDFWNRYPEDIAEAKKLGLNTLRTSIAWEKVEPAPGVFSAEAIQHYRAIFQTMNAAGIKPMIALHHFTHPQWFQDRGGWTSPDSPRLFLEYATYVVDHLKDLCELWITFNEPMILVQMGYLQASVPPQIASIDDAFEASVQLARAHRLVSVMIHQKQGQSPHAKNSDGSLRGVGLANSFQIYDPKDPSLPEDQQAAALVSDLSNWSFVRGLMSGIMKFNVPPSLSQGRTFERELPKNDLPPWDPGPMLDWIGVNYYTRYLIGHDFSWDSPAGLQGDNGWSIYPEGLERVLQQTHTQFSSLPLVVTENGLSDHDDSRRPAFIRDHLASVQRALHAGLDIRGYYHWSLTDNFEWLWGFSTQRFGLIEIRYDQNLARVPRPSAQVYASEIRRFKK